MMPSYQVPEMSCEHCKAAIEKAVAGVDKAARIVVDLKAKTVLIESRAEPAALCAAIEKADYEVQRTA